MSHTVECRKTTTSAHMSKRLLSLPFKRCSGKERAVNSLWLQQWEWLKTCRLISSAASSGTGGRVPDSSFSSIWKIWQKVRLDCCYLQRGNDGVSVSQQSGHNAQQSPCGEEHVWKAEWNQMQVTLPQCLRWSAWASLFFQYLALFWLLLPWAFDLFLKALQPLANRGASLL